MKTNRYRITLILGVLAILLIAAVTVTIVTLQYTEKESYGKQMEIAEKYYAVGDYNNAIIYYQKAIRKEPERTEAYVRLAESYIAQGQDVMAEATLNLGISKTNSATMILMVDRLHDASNVQKDKDVVVNAEVKEEKPTEEQKQEENETDKKTPTASSSKVISATTGKSVYNAKIKFYKGTVATGTPVETVKTNSFGKYDVILESGTYTAVVECSGYITEKFSVYIGSGRTAPSENFIITPELGEGQIRIVLEWGAEPADLDSYLDGKLDSGHSVHVNFRNKVEYYDGETRAELDVDDITGYGPETTTIYDINGEFIFSVEDFQKTGTMANSGATVKIYLPGETSPKIVRVPSTAVNLWTVCKIDHGELTIY